MSNTQNKRDDRGVVAIELAFLVPFLFMLLVGIVAVGNVFVLKASAEELAREGARVAALKQPLPAGTSVVPENPAVPNDTASCASPAEPAKFFITVEATKSVSLRSIPLIGVDFLPSTITETVTMRCGG